MAKITLVGFVSNWKFGEDTPNPSWAMKVSEPHSKNMGTKEAPNWQKTGSTNYIIKNAYGQDEDFSRYRQGERVEVTGTLISEDWEANGKKGKNIIVKASHINVLERGNQFAPSVGTREQAPNDGWVVVDDEVPF